MSKICVVDDSKFQLNSIKTIMVELGYEVEAFNDSTLALEALKSNQYDCLCTDLLMPNIDGMALVQEVKKINSKMPTIVLTANVQDTVEKKCKELGVNYFLNKPVNKEMMRSVLKNVIKESN